MSLSGIWYGNGESYVSAQLKIKICTKNERIRLWALTNAGDRTNELIELNGVVEEGKTANLELVKYLSDDPNNISPNNANVTLEYDESADIIEGKFATNQGTSGTFRLRRGNLSTRLIFFIPVGVHALYKRTKKTLRRNFRNLYLLFVVALATFSVAGYFPTKINAIEALILLIPLLFLFSKDIRKIISDMRVSKLGPIEFKEQSEPNNEVNISKILQSLQANFGDNLPLFTTLSEFFVPRTKILLQHLVEYGKPLTLDEFKNIAINIGVQRDNIDATMKSLISGQCVEVDKNGIISVSKLAASYLSFESLMKELNRT